MLETLIIQHQQARETMESIENGLTDDNFHTMCNLLHEGLYNEAKILTETIFKEG